MHNGQNRQRNRYFKIADRKKKKKRSDRKEKRKENTQWNILVEDH
jgi:hypothetical protein